MSIVSIDSQGIPMRTEVYAPPATAPRGVVVIAHGSDGLTNHLTGPWATMIRGYAGALADNGLTAIVPEYFTTTDTKPEQAIAQILEHRDRWQGAISDAVDHAKTLASAVGLLGFSLGGHLCLRVRAKATVLVEFFAPVFDGIGPAGTLTHAQIHHGEADALEPTKFPNAIKVRDELKAECPDVELFPYPKAGHGFIGNDAHNTSARDLSKERTLKFFASHL